MQPVPAHKRMVGGRLELHVMMLEWRPQEKTMEVAPADCSKEKPLATNSVCLLNSLCVSEVLIRKEKL